MLAIGVQAGLLGGLIVLLVRRAKQGAILAGVYEGAVYATFLGFVGQLRAGVSLANLLGAAALAVGSYRWARKQRSPAPWHAADLLALLLLLWTILTAAYHSRDLDSVRAAAVILSILLASKFSTQLSGTDLDRILRTLSRVGLALAVICIIEAWVDPELGGLVSAANLISLEGLSRVTGLQGNPNGAAFYLLIAHCATLARLGTRPVRRWPSIVLLLVDATLVLAVVLTNSRAAFGGVVIVLLVAAIRITGVGLRTALVVAILCLGLVGAYGPLRETIESTLFPDRPLSDTGRDSRWQLGLEAISRNPVFGDPLVVFDFEHVVYHNDVMQLAADTGILGGFLLALIMLYAGWMFVRGDPSRSNHRTFFLLVFVTAAIMSLFHGLLLGGICFWLVVGIALNNRGVLLLHAKAP